jgi:hypothetical protein
METILNNLLTMQALWIALLGFAYFFFNELEDESIKNNWERWEWFLNTGQAWKNKWKLDEEGRLTTDQGHWWHFGLSPLFEERFPYSSTLLVFLTDGEHLFQFFKNLAVLGAVAVISPWMAVAVFIGMRLAAFIKEQINWIQ